MRLAGKLTALTLVVATVPLAIAGYSLERLSRGALSEQLEEDHNAVARSFAARLGDDLAAAEQELSHAPSLLPAGVPTPEILVGMLRVLYHNRDDATAVWLLDATGAEVVPAQHVISPRDAPGLEAHEPASVAEVGRRRARLPLAQALTEGRAVEIYHPAGDLGRPAHLLLVIRITLPGPEGGVPRVLAYDLTLARAAALLANADMGTSALALVNRGRDGTERLAAGRFAAERPGSLLRADAKVPGAPLAVAVTARPEIVFARVSDLRARSLYWLGVAIASALVCAIVFARELSTRVRRLAARCAAIARGRFDERVPVTSNDELSELASSLNKMADDLDKQTRDLREQSIEIARKNEEITSWNQELERRVADKTRELAEAQELILRSRNLAAVGTLGAGMAHEINNPLTGVLGLAQILQGELPEGDTRRELVVDIEQQALRIQKIVASLMQLSKWDDGHEMVSVDLNQIIADALGTIGEGELTEHGISLERRLTSPLPVIRGNPIRLQKAFVELVTNAQRAMPKGGTLSLETTVPDPNAVIARIEDTGVGIAADQLGKIFDPFFTTKQNWSSTGMGLTMVHKIVEQHQGTIAVRSRPGGGATFTLTFPAAPGPTHLD